MPMSEYMRSLRDKVGIAVRSETGERTPRPDGDETLEVRYFVRSELSGIHCKAAERRADRARLAAPIDSPHSTRMEELAYQRWSGERVVEETFFYDPSQLVPRKRSAR